MAFNKGCETHAILWNAYNLSSQCITPFFKKESPGTPLPCGRCPGCISRRTSGWSFRLRKESELHTLSEFVLLTYEECPRTPRNYRTLKKSDVQSFFKRLRKLTDKRIKKHYKKKTGLLQSKIKTHATIKYYLCGEYGTQFGRPHYHIILFGAEQQDIIEAWINPKTKKPIGHVFFGYDTSEAAVGYTLKYLSKESRVPVHKNDDRQPEFALMSKRLGANYLTDEIKKWHTKSLEKNCYLPLKDGKKAALPRYYKSKIYDSVEAGHLKGFFETLSINQTEKAIKKHGQDYHSIKAKSDKAAFLKMHYREKQNRTL